MTDVDISILYQESCCAFHLLRFLDRIIEVNVISKITSNFLLVSYGLTTVIYICIYLFIYRYIFTPLKPWNPWWTESNLRCLVVICLGGFSRPFCRVFSWNGQKCVCCCCCWRLCGLKIDHVSSFLSNTGHWQIGTKEFLGGGRRFECIQKCKTRKSLVPEMAAKKQGLNDHHHNSEAFIPILRRLPGLSQ